MYRNPDPTDKNFNCLLAAMTKVQSVDSKASFLFVGDANARHKEWLALSTTNLHGRTERNFASSSGC